MELTAVLIICVVVAIVAFAYYKHTAVATPAAAADVPPDYTQSVGTLWTGKSTLCADDTLVVGDCILPESDAATYCKSKDDCLGYLRPSDVVRAKNWPYVANKDAVQLVVEAPTEYDDWPGTTYFKKTTKV